MGEGVDLSSANGEGDEVADNSDSGTDADDDTGWPDEGQGTFGDIKRREKMIEIAASLHEVKIDDEGESTIKFRVPQSELGGIIELSQLTQKLLRVRINADESGTE